LHPVIYLLSYFSVRRNWRKKRPESGDINMIAWEPMTDDEPSSEKTAIPGSAGMLYGLTAAFPSWAGVLLAIYAIFLSGTGVAKFDANRIRPR